MSRANVGQAKVQWLFLIAAILGFILPVRHFVRFLLSEGLNVSAFMEQLFQNDVSAFFAMDVVVSTVSLWLFVFIEGRRRRMKALWVYVVCTLLVGVSLALPLFLFFRERRSG